MNVNKNETVKYSANRMSEQYFVLIKQLHPIWAIHYIKLTRGYLNIIWKTLDSTIEVTLEIQGNQDDGGGR